MFNLFEGVESFGEFIFTTLSHIYILVFWILPFLIVGNLSVEHVDRRHEFSQMVEIIVSSIFLKTIYYPILLALSLLFLWYFDGESFLFWGSTGSAPLPFWMAFLFFYCFYLFVGTGLLLLWASGFRLFPYKLVCMAIACPISEFLMIAALEL